MNTQVIEPSKGEVMEKRTDDHSFRRGIALIGYRATGKSTVGRLIADRLGWEFVDADEALEGRIGRTIASVFAEQGESAFRDLEEETIAELSRRDRLVLATGGGAVLRPSNREAIGRFGFVAWLSATPETIVGRLRDDPGNRPSLTEKGLCDEVAELLQQRMPLYRSLADETIETEGKTAEEVADDVVNSFLRSR